MARSYVIGLDFGSDSVRAVLVDAATGEQAAESVCNYARWGEGLYCDPERMQFRQHPKDYLEALETVLVRLLDQRRDIAPQVCAISLDFTASTPCLADSRLKPLSLQERYAENPDAMFVLWKDHTGEKEAAEINRACAESATNYSKFTGNHYSSECFWSKVLHLLRSDEGLRRDAYTVVEACDWIPAVLTGNDDPSKARMGHCCAAQKMFWSREWGGFPPREFFERIDPVLLPILDTLRPDGYTCDKPYGHLSAEWASRLGLGADIVVGTGNVDSHQGAIGAGVACGRGVMNLGTSAGVMAVMPPQELGGRVIDGVFGQVESGILPGLVGFEVGLSAFGDVFAWFRRILSYPTERILARDESLTPQQRERLIKEIGDDILRTLAEDAAALPLREDAPFATDWLNGRRSPAPNQRLWGSLMGLRLSSSAPELYYALVESTAFAFRAIFEHLEGNGLRLQSLIGIGGISQKSPFVMQMLADATGKRIEISSCKQAAALGSAICASVVGGIYPDIESAQRVMCRPTIRTYEPDGSKAGHFGRRYALYRAADAFTCSLTEPAE